MTTSSKSSMNRRQFATGIAGGAAALALGNSAIAQDSTAAKATEEYGCTYYSFKEHPKSDSCWSLSVGPDGRIYVAACCEGQPGGIVKVVRYNEKTDSLDYLFDADKAVNDPFDSGRATQCKIHYSFAPSMRDGIMYMATHLSGPPIDLQGYSPWYFWHDPKRCFVGSALMAFDTKTDKILWYDTLIPKEGCRCLLHDEERNLLYALSYPRDHFFIYDLKTKKRRDVGRIGSVNAQVLFLDKKHRVWTTSDYGRLVRYDPEKDRLEWSPYVLPHNPNFQTGWHSVFYDAVQAPDGDSVFAGTWIAQPYLMRIWPNAGDWGRVENLGPATQDRDPTLSKDTFVDHCGGLTVGGDNQVYFVASRWRDPVYNPMPGVEQEMQGVVWRINPETNQREEVTILKSPEKYSQYVSRGAVDRNGDLFFGHVGSVPAGMFKIAMPANRKRQDAHLPIRMWG